MGFFWDLLQESWISDQKVRTESLEKRVERLEEELNRSRILIHALISRLEEKLGQDINGDGRIG